MPSEDISAIWAQVNPMRDEIQQLKSVQSEHARRLDEHARMSSEQHAEIKVMLEQHSRHSAEHYKLLSKEINTINQAQALKDGKAQGIKSALGWFIVVLPAAITGAWVVARAISG